MLFTFLHSQYLIYLDTTCALNEETQHEKEEWYSQWKKLLKTSQATVSVNLLL